MNGKQSLLKTQDLTTANSQYCLGLGFVTDRSKLEIDL